MVWVNVKKKAKFLGRAGRAPAARGRNRSIGHRSHGPLRSLLMLFYRRGTRAATH